MRGAFLAILLLASTTPSVTAEGVEVTYLANEGFLLAAGDEKVLVDALFPGLQGYPRVPGELRKKLDRGDAPFDGVDLVLATHFHGDHFGAREVGEFLDSSAALFVSTPDAVELLEKHAGSDLRTMALYPNTGATSEVEIGGIDLTVLNLHHGLRRRHIQNLGFIIEMGGLKLLHVGDTEVSVEDVLAYDLAGEEIDVALVPIWFLAEPTWQGVVEAIAPGHVVAMHLASPDAPASWFGTAGSRTKRLERVRGHYPDVWIPTEPLESRTFAPSG